MENLEAINGVLSGETINLNLGTAPNTLRPLEKLEFCVVNRPADIIMIQRFRAKVFSQMFNVVFDNGLDVDEYDAYSLHAVVKEVSTGKIVAYTRVITPSAKLKLGAYYSENEYDLSQYLHQKTGVYELGRTCVDIDYRGGKALAVLWSGLLPLVFDTLKAQYIIGCVSLSLDVGQEKIIATGQYLQKLSKNRRLDVRCLRPVQIEDWIKAPLLPIQKSLGKKQKLKWGLKGKLNLFKFKKSQVPSLFKKYKKMKAKFALRPYYDPMFNCLDYFAVIKVTLLTRLKIQLVCKLMELKK